MRRTQLYLEDDLWTALRVRARQSGVSMSELVRQAVRDRYFPEKSNRQDAMRGVVGIRKNRPEMGDAEEYIRRLRKSSRLERISK